jgi:hypothetical protein
MMNQAGIHHLRVNESKYSPLITSFEQLVVISLLILVFEAPLVRRYFTSFFRSGKV